MIVCVPPPPERVSFGMTPHTCTRTQPTHTHAITCAVPPPPPLAPPSPPPSLQTRPPPACLPLLHPIFARTSLLAVEPRRIESERWRAVSFDEMKAEGSTHGDGGDRAGATERIVICGPNDDGETMGNRKSRWDFSLVGGSNALGEPLPPFACLAASTVDTRTFKWGPVAVVNGKQFPFQGICNPKGSIDSNGAVQLVYCVFIPMFNAHGGLSSDKWGVVVCDGCTAADLGTHSPTPLRQRSLLLSYSGAAPI